MTAISMPQNLIHDHLYALVSDQQTAMSETCLCGSCLQLAGVQDMLTPVQEDVVDGQVYDVSDNDALSCTRCGRGDVQG